MASNKDCLYSEFCKLRKDLCVTENLQNVEKECPHFKNKDDFAEVKHGEWISVVDDTGKKRKFLYKCSECGRGIVCVDGLEKFPYCHCGAKMDGRSDT